MTSIQTAARVTHWQGSEHPTFSNITRLMKKESLRPYMWENKPNYRYGIRSHGFDKVMFVLEGTLEITLPDTNRQLTLRSGDRIDVPAGIRYGAIVGIKGVKCIEAAVARR